MKHSVVILIFNSKGELALQKRSASDDKYPSRWDFSAGGGIEAGELPEAAAKRELFEEIGVRTPLVYVTQMLYPGSGKDDQDDLMIYRSVYDGPFTLDPKEVAELKFFPMSQITEMVRECPQQFHPELPFFLEHYSL